MLPTGFLALTLALAAGGCATNDDATPGAMGDRPNGAACANRSECASGICNGAVCQAQVNGLGLANGGACRAHTECASGYCIRGTCEATPGGTATNRPIGSPCTSSEQCTSNRCESEICRDPATLDAGTSDAGEDTGAAGDARNDRPDRADGGGDDGGDDGGTTEDASADATDGGTDGGSPTNPDPTMPPTVETRVNGEICDDALDNDGDGQVNEDCPCNPGDRMQCYPGRADEAGGARCNWGSMTCGAASRWGACTGFGRPQMEECNGVDDNCDGQVDEECGCPAAGMTRSCYAGPMGSAGVGVCRSGAQRCAPDMAGRLMWGDCDGMIVPNFESCNRVDDDCDGQVDEGCECELGATRACTVGSGMPDRGVCRGGSQRCLPRADGGSTWGACAGAVGPSMETCNGADDNCDGVIDEGCACTAGQVRSCYNGPAGTAGRGICRAGMMMCQADGTWSACVGATLPSNGERCNMMDDDCDGEADEGCLCMTGETAVYRPRAVTMPPVCGLHMGDGGSSLVRTCERGGICPEGEVGVEQDGRVRCVEAPPRCEMPLHANYYRASGWVCDRGCEVLIRYGGAFGERTVCAQRPSDASCRDSCFRSFNPTLQAWQCSERCAGGMAGIRFLGMQVCLPCPDPPGDRIRPRD
jgi:hypothetical protein